MAHTAADAEWMISVDDHLIEPPNVWTDRLPAKYRDVGPRWFEDDKGEAWHYEDNRTAVGGAVTSGAIWPPGNRPPVFNPLRWDEIPRACHDPKARLAAMDEDHILASLLFPNLPGFAGGLFVRAKDKQLALLCVQAYNDWLIDEWCASAPGRFIPLALLPMWDGTLAAAEAARTIAKGARAVSFSMAPHNLGLPPIHDPNGHWDPLFSVLDETNVPLCTHLGTGIAADFDLTKLADVAKSTKAGDPGELAKAFGMGEGSPSPRVAGVLMQLAGQTTLVEWLYSGNFERFANLKLCLSENGIGWIPAVLQSADWMTGMSRERVTHPVDPENDPLLTEDARRMAKLSLEARATRDKDAPLPSEVFHQHVYGCFIDDAVGLKLLDEIGVDNVMIETDFPHNSTWYPFSMEKAQSSLGHLPSATRWKVLRGNAERVFNFTPTEPPSGSADS